MSGTALSRLYTGLYIDFLKSVALDDPTLEAIVSDIALGTMLNGPLSPEELSMATNSTSSVLHAPFQVTEILTFGTPARHHLDLSVRRRVLKDVKATLDSITAFFYGVDVVDNEDPSSTLLQDIEVLADGTQTIYREIGSVSHALAELIIDIVKLREGFDQELLKAVSTTLPTYDAALSASIDVLAATIEASLIKLSLVRARSERAFYNHQPSDDYSGNHTISDAIAAAYSRLKEEEKDMKAEGASLDRQLQEYETLLQLVDGGNGGYQQIIKDWTKVKQETEECLKDLRRLGWTGD